MTNLRPPALLLAVLVTVVGCSSGPERSEIVGRVTYKGEPVTDGIVDFEPLDGQGSKDGAQIGKDGSYVIPKDKGLFPGRYKVSIYIGDGYETSGDASPDAPKKRATAGKPGVERAPKEFNTDSKQVREVKAGLNTFDFDIP